MNSNGTLFEWLANEIVLEIFSYLDIRNLYRAFDGLNIRLNDLVRSIHQSYLVLSPEDNEHDFDQEIYSSSIDTLIVQRNADVSLGHFPNLHRLILHWLPRNVLDKLELDALPLLEYLSIRFRRNTDEDSIFDFPQKIFTNGFSRLRICILPDVCIGLTDRRWIECPLITVLKIGNIDLDVYRDLLSCCSNLRTLECALNRWSTISVDIPAHPNVRTLILKRLMLNHRIFKHCLSCVPNVQRLDLDAVEFSVSPGIFQSKIDTFKFISNSNLPKLHRMNFHVILFLDFSKDSINLEFLRRLEAEFFSGENNTCQKRLTIERRDLRDRKSFDEMMDE